MRSGIDESTKISDELTLLYSKKNSEFFLKIMYGGPHYFVLSKDEASRLSTALDENLKN
jgi:hypothetical protein